MKTYFQSREVSFHDSSLKVLRNRFPIKEIKYADIDKVELDRGFLLKNNILIIGLALGLIILGFSVLRFSYYEFFTEYDSTWNYLLYLFNRPSLLSIWLPLLFVLVGVLTIKTALARTHIVFVYVGDKVYKLRIWEISKLNKEIELGQFLVKKNVLTINKST